MKPYLPPAKSPHQVVTSSRHQIAMSRSADALHRHKLLYNCTIVYNFNFYSHCSKLPHQVATPSGHIKSLTVVYAVCCKSPHQVANRTRFVSFLLQIVSRDWSEIVKLSANEDFGRRWLIMECGGWRVTGGGWRVVGGMRPLTFKWYNRLQCF